MNTALLPLKTPKFLSAILATATIGFITPGATYAAPSIHDKTPYEQAGHHFISGTPVEGYIDLGKCHMDSTEMPASVISRRSPKNVATPPFNEHDPVYAKSLNPMKFLRRESGEGYIYIFLDTESEPTATGIDQFVNKIELHSTGLTYVTVSKNQNTHWKWTCSDQALIITN